MSQKKHLNYDGTAYLWAVIKNAFQAKETGKGLSEANFTQAEKAKLQNISERAEVNVNADWNAVTGDAAILNKPSIPANTSDLTNDSDFVSDANYTHITVDSSVSGSSNNPVSNSAIKGYVDDAVAAITGISFVITQTLPASGAAGTIYLVPNSGSGSNSYDEYIWIKENNVGRFEKIGTTDVDLSGYLLEADLVAITTAEIDAICV